MKFVIPILFAITILIIDRLTKIIALTYWLYSSYEVNSFLSFEVTFNRGISWGMFNDSSNSAIVFIVIMQCVIIGILSWYAHKLYKKGHNIIGYLCVISGTSSNIMDRFFYPGVVDFILIGYNNYVWPSFNIADAAIVCGVIIILWYNEEN